MDLWEEPTVLPAAIPNLLLNGSDGIAVGMATKIPPHNLKETIDAVIAWIDDPDIDVEGLMKHLPAPDFPTGGIIYGYAGVKGSIPDRPRPHCDARPDARGRNPGGPRRARHYGDPLSGQQEFAPRKDRASRQGKTHRGRQRPARRIRPWTACASSSR